MGIESTALVLRERFKALWTYSGIAWQNVPLDDVQKKAQEDSTGWVRFNVLPGQQIAAGLGGDGSTLYRTPGTIIVEIYIARGVSQNLAEQWADLAGAIFRGKELAPQITCRAPAVIVVGNEQDWYHVNVTIDFEFDENLTTN